MEDEESDSYPQNGRQSNIGRIYTDGDDFSRRETLLTKCAQFES